MLSQIFSIVAPVFLVILGGYLAVRSKLFANELIDGLMRFAILFAVPCLLFRATASMDLGTAFDWRLMLAFYVGAGTNFAVASWLARKVFQRPPGEAVAVGFVALFSNLVLVGLPISERAWGSENMASVFAIVSVHAPFCYLLGISTMEGLRSDGRSLQETAWVVTRAMFSNSLMIGLGLGFLVNFTGLLVPDVLDDALSIMSKAALPAALFALGGVLTRYQFNDKLGEIGMLALLSLFIHPMLVLSICVLSGVPMSEARYPVLLASMAPGLNTFLFASMYQRGQGTAASTVLLATVLSVFSVSGWLWYLQ